MKECKLPYIGPEDMPPMPPVKPPRKDNIMKQSTLGDTLRDIAIEVKFAWGSRVLCGGIEGLVTAIKIRGLRTSYEFSYISKDGDPKSVDVEEVELELSSDKPYGFKKKELLNICKYCGELCG